MQLVVDKKLAGLVGLLSGLVIVGIWAIVYLPEAAIEITLAESEYQIDQEIRLSQTITDPDFRNYALPLKIFSAEVKLERMVNRDGVEARPGLATGTIKLKNDQAEEQPLLPQTNLIHESTGVRFLTNKAVRIPAQGEIEVGITAKEEGETGNVPAGRFRIEKLAPSLQTTIYGDSDVALTGGLIVDDILSESEIEAALAESEAEARLQLSAKLANEAGGQIRQDLVHMSVDDRQASAEVGSQAQSFNTQVRMTGKALGVRTDDLLNLGVLALREQVPAGVELAGYDPDSFEIEIVRADFERGEVLVKVELVGRFEQKVNSGVFDTNLLAGLTSDEVANRLEQYESVARAEVEMSPFWVKTIPSRKGAVQIRVE